MKRRSFLKDGSLLGLSIPVLGRTGFWEMDGAKGPLPEGEIADDLIEEKSIEALQTAMESGPLTAERLTRAYLNRIGRIDKEGPQLNAVMALNPDALQIARNLDREREQGKVRGPLHGIPVLVKGNIDSADKMMTTAGSLALVGNYAQKDAFIIKKLREAGAVLLGKTNLSEFANFRSTHSTSGWSSRGGQTRNPNVLHRSPSGSSSGSGVAVSANLCAVAIGTETNGSVVSPSSVNGIVGIKPTVGLWSRSGIIPISSTQDTAGPMARTVKDAAILLSALAGVDTRDPTTTKNKGKRSRDYSSGLSLDALKGKRLGFERSFLKGSNRAVNQLTKDVLEEIKKAGAEVVEVDLLRATAPLGRASYELLQFEFKDGINKYLATADAPVHNLSEIIRYNKEHREKAMPFFSKNSC